ncbi:adenylosuccinate synthase [Synchytrium microbalum]|uniref:Adenylosuccinate synthetase n=1 Tax=Synchytrium microbalum TaxID=1806994 RepID=A0A507C983_9FUNG|nr:adenylosuccinate synthase [Synchytrium microbalum]TPX34065.1 adenylosuccinate synthase [Synchytrium microbalum]
MSKRQKGSNGAAAASPVAGSTTIVLGTQWGDEGKGKLVDILSQEAEVCCRFGGGNNAGHTLVVNKVKYALHLVPCGVINPKCMNLIGNGVVVHLPSMFQEIDELEAKGAKLDGRLYVSNRAHLVFDFHQIVDGLKEAELGGGNIGTTRKGIGPTYSAKASRSGLRVHHLMSDWDVFTAKFKTALGNKMKRYGDFDYNADAELAKLKGLVIRLKPMVVDTISYIHKSLSNGKHVLVEGAQSLMLDVDFGTYPYVTSSSTSIGGVCTGLGIPPSKVGKVVGVVKAYTTRVGSGPFATEQLNDVGKHLQEVGFEWGVTTGRRRRCGWLDMVVLRYSHMVNGYTSVNLTKLDVLDQLDEIKIAVGYKYKGELLESFPADLDLLEHDFEVVYETFPGWKKDISSFKKYNELPENARKYIERIETLMGVPVEWIGVGADRAAMIHKPL